MSVAGWGGGDWRRRRRDGFVSGSRWGPLRGVWSGFSTGEGIWTGVLLFTRVACPLEYMMDGMRLVSEALVAFTYVSVFKILGRRPGVGYSIKNICTSSD